jgi:pimeloyl-ACP methyl ester carboxylesterase
VVLPARRTGFLDHDGESLYYEVVGDGRAPQVPIVLCHGAGGNHAIWFQQVAPLAADRTVVTWDHRGFGRSSDRAARSGPEVAAGDLLALCDHLGVERADLVAQSMGGWTVVGAALQRPSLVRSLVLADTPAGFTSPAITEALAGARRESVLEGWKGDLLGEHPALDPSFPVSYPELAHLYQCLGRMGSPDLTAIMPRLGATHHDEGEAARLTMPVLCIVGEHDALIAPAAVAAVAALLPNARLVEIPGCGHSPYFEDPETWNDAVRSFLDEVAAADDVHA